MLDEKQLKAVDKLLEMYNEIEMGLLVDIARHFQINEEFINSDYWRIKKLEEMGMFNQDIVNFLARYNKKTPGEIKKALQKIGIETYNLDRLTRAFEDGQISINPNILLANGTIQAIIDSQYNVLNGSLINMSNKIEKSVKRAYLNIVEQTYLKTSMGTHSYQEAIRESINELTKSGLTILDYQTIDETGEVIGTRKYSIEGAVRREIMTNVRNLSNSINEKVVNDLQCEYIHLSEHLDCRVQHFDWQGTIIKREQLIPITGYGEVDGLGGINCRHYFEPYFGDARGNDLKKITQDNADKHYDLTIKQRYYERGIRVWKRKVEMYKQNKDNVSLKESKKRLKMWLDRYHDFCSDNDLTIDYTRIYVSK